MIIKFDVASSAVSLLKIIFLLETSQSVSLIYCYMSANYMSAILQQVEFG